MFICLSLQRGEAYRLLLCCFSNVSDVLRAVMAEATSDTVIQVYMHWTSEL
jgi:hypothetical protein